MVYCTGKWKAWKRVVFFIHRQYDNNGSTLGWRHLESLYMSPFHSKSLCWSLVLNLWVSKSFISLFSQQVVVYFFIYFQLLFSFYVSPLNHNLQILVSDSGLTRTLGNVRLAQSLFVIREDGWERAVSQTPLSTIHLCLTYLFEQPRYQSLAYPRVLSLNHSLCRL